MTRNTLAITSLVISFCVSFLLYANTLHGDFVYDDVFFSRRTDLNNATALARVWTEPYRIRDPHAEVYRPFTVFTFALNFILFGQQSTSFHVTNIVLNGIAAWLVFYTTKKLTKNTLLSAGIAMIFMCMPVHSEAVANIKGRDNILLAICSLGSVFAFLKAREKRFSDFWKFVSAGLFLLACFAMEFALVLPLLIGVLFVYLYKPTRQSFIKEMSVYLPFLLVYVLLRWRVLGDSVFSDPKSFWYYIPLTYVDIPSRIWTAFQILYLYLQKTIFAYGLSATHHFNSVPIISNPFSSAQTLLGIALSLVLVYLALLLRKRKSLLFLGICFFLVPYIIFSKFVFPSGELLAERWMYLPSFGIAIIIGFVCYWAYLKHKMLGVLIFSILCLTYSTTTIKRNTVWLSERALYLSMIHDAPNSAQGYIGMAYLSYYNQSPEELVSYLERGRAIYADHPRFLNLAALVALGDRNYPLARAEILKSIELLPSSSSYLLYAIILSEAGEYQGSIDVIMDYFQTPLAASDERERAVANYIVAFSLAKLGKNDEARQYFDLNETLMKSMRLNDLQL